MFSYALGLSLYVMGDIVLLRFDIVKTKRLISSYDEENDTFVGKIDGKEGYLADYSICDGIFLSIDRNGCPSSVFVDNASKVFNTSKNVLENSNVKISLDCDELSISFSFFVENSRIFSSKSENLFNIPSLNFVMDANY